MEQPTIEQLRDKINELDGQLLQLLNRRAEFARQIGKLKQSQGANMFVPARENAILHRLTEQNPGPLSALALRTIYREVISACRALEKQLKVCYLGPQATFTHTAAMQSFGTDIEYMPLPSVSVVFDEVERKHADFGVVPIENSSEGIVSHTIDMFVDSRLLISAEVLLEIHHHLIGLGTLGGIKKIYSHPQGFAQCRDWLEKHIAPEVPRIEAPSTAQAVLIAQQEPESAAIAGMLAANMYEMPIIVKQIEDNEYNVTRFFVIGHQTSKPTGDDKTSIMAAISDRVGALFDLLKPFYSHGLNLTKIESRPTRRRPWEYVFFIDFAGHLTDPKVQAAVKDLQSICLLVKVLGSYPRGRMNDSE